MNVGEIRGRLAAFAKGIEALGPITDTEKKITLVGGASFTPVELVKIDRILGYFPPELDCASVMALNGCIARVLNLTSSGMGPAYEIGHEIPVKVLPDEIGAGPAPTDEPLNVA